MLLCQVVKVRVGIRWDNVRVKGGWAQMVRGDVMRRMGQSGNAGCGHSNPSRL